MTKINIPSFTNEELIQHVRSMPDANPLVAELAERLSILCDALDNAQEDGKLDQPAQQKLPFE